MDRIRSYKLSIGSLLVLSVLAIVSAHVMEHFGILPCRLCLYQRMVYYALIMVTGTVLLTMRINIPIIRTSGETSLVYQLWEKFIHIKDDENDYPNMFDSSAMIGIVLSYALLLAGMGIAVFQVLIEQNLISYESPCTTNFGALKSPKEFLSAIYNKDLVSCDKPQMTILGISLSGWNACYTLFMCVVSSIIIRKR